jgi:apolipoprotein N-acyltransferase
MFTGFGWNGLGVGLHSNAVMIQAADVIGVAGLSFTPVFCACVIFNVVRRFVLRSRAGGAFRYHFDAFIATALIAVQGVYGLRQLNAPSGETVPVRVANVQLNVPQHDIFTRENLSEHYHRYADLTNLYAPMMDLIVWPESALGLPFDHPDHEAFFNDLMSAGEFSLLTGCDTSDLVSHTDHTGAALVHKGYQNAQIHHKVHLVPFGEYLPMRHTMPFLNATLGSVLPFDFEPGTSTEPLKLGKLGVSLIPLICFEDTVGRLARQFVRNEPQIIVNMTNDGWFLRSAGPEQHLTNAIFRAIELRRPMCRACNTGVTCFIDDRGRVLSMLRDPQTNSTFIEGVLPSTIQVARHPPMTLYARFGDWFAMLCLAVCLLGAWLSQGHVVTVEPS